MADFATPEELGEMRNAGFSDDEIHQARLASMKEMFDAGFGKDEVEKAYGTKEPDMEPMRQYFKKNLEAAKEEKKKREPIDVSAKPIEAEGFIDEIAAGWSISVAGLIGRGENPSIVSSDKAPMISRIAGQIATLAGDMPAMVAGAVGGGAAGTVAAPGVGTAVGSFAGANALPAAVRTSLMQYYEKGEIQDFQDFYERSSAVLWETTKAGVIGAATGGVGSKVGKVLAPVAAPAAQAVGKTAAEIATMVSVGSALEGEVPRARDFVDATVLIGGITAATKIAKVRSVYERTGIKPEQVVEMTKNDPVLRQEILSDNIKNPRALEPMVDPAVKAAEAPPKPPAGEPPAAPPPNPPPSNAWDKIGEKISVKEQKEKVPYNTDKAYKDFVDKLDPIKQAEAELNAIIKEKNLTPEQAERVYRDARMVNDYQAKALHALEKGMFDFKTLETTTKGLNEIIKGSGADIKTFDIYLTALRALELEEKRGIKSGFDVDAARQVVKEGKVYREAARQINEFTRAQKKYLEDSGVLSPELSEAFDIANQNYVPFKRLLVESADGSYRLDKGFLKKIQGSDKSIQSPLLSLQENTVTAMRLAETNRARLGLVEKALKAGEAGEQIMRRVESPRGLSKNQFEVYVKGERQVWETLNPDLAESLNSLEGARGSQNILFKFMAGFTTVKKVGLTMAPEFIVKNLMRDQITSGVFSKYGTLPFRELVGAMGDVFAKNETYYKWLKSGGANGAFIDLNETYLKRNFETLNKQTGFIDSTFNVVKTPWQALQVLGHAIESAPRVAEFKKVTKGVESGPKLFEGGFASREITLDFMRSGAKIQALNSIIAFLNVKAQGLDKTFRAIKENPSGTAIRGAGLITAPSLLLWWAQKDDPRYQEIPRWQKDLFWIVLTDKWEKVTDQDEIGGVPEHLLRETETGLEINRGHIWRIPKPGELGLMFGSLPERIAEKYIQDNPDAMKDLTETMVETVTPSLVPDMVAPVLEQQTNYSTFTGQPIVPHYLESQLPSDRYTDYTSETSKALGRILGTIPQVRDKDAISPMFIDNYVRSWGGTLGQYALQLSDKLLVTSGAVDDKIKPEMNLENSPFFKAFLIRNPSASSQSIRDFYEKSAKAEQLLNTFKTRLKKGKYDEAIELYDLYDGQIQNLKGYKDAMSKQMQIIRRVQEDQSGLEEIKQMEKDGASAEDIDEFRSKVARQKRQIIDNLYFYMIEISKRGLEMSRELEKSMNEQ